METRDELLVAVAGRYRTATRAEKSRILSEFSEITGYHRKHAERLLRRGQVAVRPRPRPERRVYDQAVREALVVLWEASDRICGKRLKPLIPLLIPAMERHGHLELDEEVRSRLLEISAATIDRALAPVRSAASGGKRRRKAHSSAVRRSVPVRTYADWGDPAPGYMEADLVAHSGPSASGSFVQTLTLTDVATGWTECVPLLFREQRLLSEVMTALLPVLPFPLLGFDTDNDSVFMNETIKGWCEAAGVEFTRSRPYRKNDQAHVEQKNGAVVRRMVGYRRYAGIAAARELACLYRSMRLFVNFFQPSFKLMEKTRDGARVTKRYHAPLTPFQRVMTHPEVSQAAKLKLSGQFAQLDPVVLLHDIRQPQARLAALPETALSFVDSS
ncbi:transposase family protein [Leisingera daeponensis]|nr:transposase family protein [Leisingera daeponensis]